MAALREFGKFLVYGIPVWATFICLFTLGSASDYLERHSTGIEGVYAKVMEIEKVVTVPGERDEDMDVIDVKIDLGYGVTRTATLVRPSYLKRTHPHVGQVILVASKDGKDYRDQFYGLTIRPVYASWI
jgi:hypothetical protein